MYTLNVDTAIDGNPVPGRQATRLMQQFGLRVGRFKQRLRLQCSLSLKPGQICLITGPVGSGKSILLNSLSEQVCPDNRIRLDEISLSPETPVIDSIPPEVSGSVNGRHILSNFGLGDDAVLLTPSAVLSTGQQSQYRLAQAFLSGRQWIIADDFAATLDRVSACVTAYHLRKLVTKTETICLLACCREAILDDLRPDVLVVQSGGSAGRVIYRDKTLIDHQ